MVCQPDQYRSIITIFFRLQSRAYY